MIEKRNAYPAVRICKEFEGRSGDDRGVVVGWNVLSELENERVKARECLRR